MSRFLREFRSRVDRLTAPHRRYYGDSSPVVLFAADVIAEAEELEKELAGAVIATAEASDRTGWSVETLQKYAKLKLAGAELPKPWAALQVEETPSGYTFALGTIPPNPRSAGA